MATITGRQQGFGDPVGRTQTIVVIVATLVVVLGLSAWIANPLDDGVTSIDLRSGADAVAPEVGKAPTPFTGLTYDGRTVSLADYAGKPLWLTFGASWCQDCRVEAADLEATYEASQGRGLNVLAVFINDPKQDIASYASRAGLTFPIIADEAAKIGGAYRLVGIPTHVFIGADGVIRQIRIGALSKADMEQSVEALLR